MDGGLKLTISGPTRDRAIAKIALIVLAGVVFGYWNHMDAVKKANEAKALTAEDYARGYEAHKAELINGAQSPGIDIPVGVVLLLFVFGVYEVIGIAFGVAIGKLLLSDSSPPQVR